MLTLSPRTGKEIELQISVSDHRTDYQIASNHITQLGMRAEWESICLNDMSLGRRSTIIMNSLIILLSDLYGLPELIQCSANLHVRPV
jgi:hypothetical protein